MTFSDLTFLFAVVTVLGQHYDVFKQIRFIEEEHSVLGIRHQDRLEHGYLGVKDVDRGWQGVQATNQKELPVLIPFIISPDFTGRAS